MISLNVTLHLFPATHKTSTMIYGKPLLIRVKTPLALVKCSILTLIIFFTGNLNAQEYKAKASDPATLIPTATNYRTYGYIDGKRLDSVDATYAVFSLFTQDRVLFDYGQLKSRAKDYAITDSKGAPMMFPAKSYAFMLNFFHFNGWELSAAYSDSASQTYILKKREPRYGR